MVVDQKNWGVELRKGVFQVCDIEEHAGRNLGKLAHPLPVEHMEGEILGEDPPGILIAIGAWPDDQRGCEELARRLNETMPAGVPSFAWTPTDYQRAQKVILEFLRARQLEVPAEQRGLHTE